MNMNERDKAWKDSIFADTKFMADLRRKNIVREIFNEGYDAALKSSQWVKVEDRLPEADGEYLAALKSPSWSVLMYVVIEWKGGDWKRDSNVVAWMPIPEYQEEKEKVEPLTKERLDKMTPAEIAELDWKEVREVLSQ